MASNTKKVRLTRDLIMGEKDSLHEVPNHLAHDLIGSGSAVQHFDEGEEPEAGPTSVHRMESPGNADPKPRRISGPKPKVREGE